jgi:hypothetical protein
MNQHPHPLSVDHTIVIEPWLDGDLIARQVNNQVPIPEEWMSSGWFSTAGSSAVRLSAEAGPKGQQIGRVVKDPVTVILFSSYALLNGSEWTSNQPSEGIFVLAEWLSRNQLLAAPLAVDPNLAQWSSIENIISLYARRGRRIIIGFSVLPVNLQNDIDLICKVKAMVPNSHVVLGGIGSESLKLLRTESGEVGLEKSLPIDGILSGDALNELSSLVEAVWTDHRGVQPSSNSQREQPKPVEIETIQNSRALAHELFIPHAQPDLIHEVGYQAANAPGNDMVNMRIIPVLVDNRCRQGCYFCASPKNQIFASVDEAFEHVVDKAKDAEVIAFNDNDLSNDASQTIELCKLLISEKMMQPKHGKMRASEYHPNLIDSLAEAGFVRIAIGVESFSDAVRNSLGKGQFTGRNIELTIEHLLRTGIKPEINLILFTPHETIETLLETTVEALRWIERGALLYVTFGLFATPNSPRVARLLKSGSELTGVVEERIFLEGMHEAIMYPTKWKSPDALELISERLLAERIRVMDSLKSFLGGSAGVPIEAFASVVVLAGELGLPGYTTVEVRWKMIVEYAQSLAEYEYVSI